MQNSCENANLQNDCSRIHKKELKKTKEKEKANKITNHKRYPLMLKGFTKMVFRGG